MKRSQRKVTPRVRGGKVQRKNRDAPTPNYWNTPQRVPVLDKKRPGRGFKHYLRKEHIARFIRILPDWDKLSDGLDAIILSEGGDHSDGWFSRSVIGIAAWPRDSRLVFSIGYFRSHADIFERLGVKSTRQGNHYVCHFAESQVRAYQLLHIFLHELGHHHDRYTTHGEGYAELYARKYETLIWERYLREFELEGF